MSKTNPYNVYDHVIVKQDIYIQGVVILKGASLIIKKIADSHNVLAECGGTMYMINIYDIELYRTSWYIRSKWPKERRAIDEARRFEYAN